MAAAVGFVGGLFGFGGGAAFLTGGGVAFKAWTAGLAFGGTLLGGLTAKLLGTVALSALSAALAPGVKQGGGITIATTLRGEDNPETVILGRYATGGQAICPPMSHGPSNRYLTHVIELCSAPGAQIARIMLGDEWITLGATEHPDYGRPVLGDKYGGHVWVRYLDGSQTAADPMLRAKYGSHPALPWTADMIGAGLCYAIMTFYYDQEKLPQVPRYRFEMTGIPVYDLRQDSTMGGSGAQRLDDPSTWAVSHNPIVLAWNIMRGLILPGGDVWGGHITDLRRLPQAVWVAGMNACDVAVDGADGPEPMYRAGLEVALTEAPASALEELFKTCSAVIADLGQGWGVQVGAPPLPTLSISDADILVSEVEELDPFPSLQDSWNAVTANFPDPANFWETREAPQRTNAAWEAADTFGRRMATLSLPAAPYPAQVQRLMLAWIEDERRFRRHTLTLPPDSAGVELIDAITWTSVRNSYAGKAFTIHEIVEDPFTGLRRFTIRETDPGDWIMPPDYLLPSPAAPVPPGITPITLPEFAATPVTMHDDAAHPRRAGVRLTWSPDLDAEGVLWSIRLAGTAPVILSGTTQDVAAGQIDIFEGLLPATAYQVRAKPIARRTTTASSWLPVTTDDVRLSMEELDAAARQRVEDLEAWMETYPDEVDTALQGLEVDYQAAADAAALAVGAKDAAEVAAGASGVAAAAAEAAQSVAETARTQAQTAATNADSSASAAAGSASTATTKATEAGNSATAAAASVVAASSAALSAIAVEGNPGFEQGVTGWASNAGRSNPLLPEDFNIGPVAGRADVLMPVNPMGSTGVYQVKALWLQPDRTYRIRASVVAVGTAGKTVRTHIGVSPARPTGGHAGGWNNVASGLTLAVDNGWYDLTSAPFTLEDIQARDATSTGVYVRITLNLNNSDPDVNTGLEGVWLEDITESERAEGFAFAASEHAESASISADAAQVSAAAAATDRLAAETAKGQAEIASNAAVSARDDAAGSASTAASQATTATAAATNAGDSATAAAGSATVASTSATEAEQSASAAAAAATTAATQAGEASTAASNAASSATSAAGSASAASTSASTAADARDAAGGSATAAATSATQAASSASDAGAAAASATTARNDAQTAASSASTSSGTAVSARNDAQAAASAAATALTQVTAQRVLDELVLDPTFAADFASWPGGNMDDSASRFAARDLAHAIWVFNAMPAPRAMRITPDDMAATPTLWRGLPYQPVRAGEEVVVTFDYARVPTGVQPRGWIRFRDKDGVVFGSQSVTGDGSGSWLAATLRTVVPEGAVEAQVYLMGGGAGWANNCWVTNISAKRGQEAYASGALKIESVTAGPDAVARAGLQVRAHGQAPAAAALFLEAMSDGSSNTIVKSDGFLVTDGSTTAPIFAVIQGEVYVTGRLTAQYLDVDGFISIKDSGALSAFKQAPDDVTDGLYFGQVQEGAQTKFALSASRTTGSGIPQEVRFGSDGFKLSNAQFYYNLATPDPVVRRTANLAITDLQNGDSPPKTAKMVRIPAAIGGGGGGGGGGTSDNNGGDGGDTVIELYDGSTLKMTITAKGGAGGVGATAAPGIGQGGRGVDPGNRGGGGQAGSSLDNTGRQRRGGGGAAGQRISRDWIDVSSWSNPRIKITIGGAGSAGAAGTSPTPASPGIAGMATYQIMTAAEVRAGPVPLAPTAIGSFTKANNAAGNLPNLGPGMWVLYTQEDQTLNLGYIAVADGAPLHAPFAKSLTFVATRNSPAYTATSGTRTIHYLFYSMRTPE